MVLNPNPWGGTTSGRGVYVYQERVYEELKRGIPMGGCGYQKRGGGGGCNTIQKWCTSI